jgi:hypothetical protein
MRAQGELFGPVASHTTALRALGEIGNVDLYRIDERRAAARAHLWSQLPDGVPQATYAGGVSMGAASISTSLPDLPVVADWQVNKVEASFGITLAAEAGVILSKGPAEAIFDVTITFARSEPTP